MRDLDKPSPDRGKEALRLALREARDEIEWNTASSDISFELTDTLFGLATEVLAAVTELQSARDEFRATVEALNARLAAVEAVLSAYEPPATTEPEEPAADA